MNNAKIILDRRTDINGQPVVAIYGIIVGETFGIDTSDASPDGGLRRLVMADVQIIIDPNKRWVEPPNAQLGSPEDIMEHHLDPKFWTPEQEFWTEERRRMAQVKKNV